jgi:NRPS condensation-like uncharacterized protein
MARKIGSIPEKLPTVVADRILAGWHEYGLGDMTIHLRMEFDKKLDPERLEKAVLLSLDAEPVLGCRFVVKHGLTRWERIPADRRSVFFTSGPEGEESFVCAPCDPFGEPQLKTLYIPGPSGDTLILKLSHSAADAGGVKHAASVVSEIYRKLGKDPCYTPAPNLKGDRGLDQVTRNLPHAALARGLLNYARYVAGLSRCRSAGQAGDGSGAIRHATLHIPRERGGALADYGRERGATINDMAIAAILRAVSGMAPEPGVPIDNRLMTTVDLRRYIPGGRAGGVCNLSAFEYLNIGSEIGGSFDETLERVVAATSGRKADWLGVMEISLTPAVAVLPYAALGRLFISVFNKGIRDGVMPNALTNMGPIERGDVDFDGAPKSAHLVVPAMYTPMLGVGISGYEGSLTLTCGVRAPKLALAAAFLGRIASELPV